MNKGYAFYWTGAQWSIEGKTSPLGTKASPEQCKAACHDSAACQAWEFGPAADGGSGKCLAIREPIPRDVPRAQVMTPTPMYSAGWPLGTRSSPAPPPPALHQCMGCSKVPAFGKDKQCGGTPGNVLLYQAIRAPIPLGAEVRRRVIAGEKGVRRVVAPSWCLPQSFGYPKDSGRGTHQCICYAHRAVDR